MIKLELPQLDIRNLPEGKKAEAVNDRVNRIVTNLEIMLESIEDGEGDTEQKVIRVPPGAGGKSAYEYAVEAGYTGTEQEFAEKMAQEIPEYTSELINDSGFITSSNGTATRSQAIPYGEVDSSSSSTVFTATLEGITELKDGTAMLLKNGVVTSATNFTIDINGLGAKPVYNNLATGYEGTNPTRDTTIFNIAYTMLFVYSEDLVDGGCWICYRGYDSNTIGYQLRTNSTSLPMSDIVYRYRLLFTSADGTKFVPANTSTSTNATALRAVNQRPIDPFGDIVYYGTTASVAAGSRPSTAYLWRQYAITLGYTFNRTGAALSLTSWKPVYLKCTPQSDGSAIIDATTPYTQTLPSNEDGKIYIFLGVAYAATTMELMYDHPIYYYKDGCIRQWTNCTADEIVAMTGAEILEICQ